MDKKLSKGTLCDRKKCKAGRNVITGFFQEGALLDVVVLAPLRRASSGPLVGVGVG